MGDWTGSVPIFNAGSKVRAADMSTVAAILSALTDGLGDYVSTVTQLTKGSGGTLLTKYRRLGKNVDGFFLFVFGTGSAVSGIPTFTLPVAPNSYYPSTSGSILPSATLFIDSGNSQRDGFLGWNGTAAQILYWNAGLPASPSATAPWTWNAGDQMMSRFWYETA